MTIRQKLFTLIGLSILLVIILFIIFKISTSKIEAYGRGVHDLDNVGSTILTAIVAEKNYLKTHEKEAAAEVLAIINQAASKVAGLHDHENFTAKEIKSLEGAVAAYKNAFQVDHELTGRVDMVRSQVDTDIREFISEAMKLIEKVDEAVANAFMEGESPDVTLQSLSDVTRTAIFLMNKITLSMNRDLFISNNPEKFIKNTNQVFNSLKSIRTNLSTFRKRLKSDDKSYLDFVGRAEKMMTDLPQKVELIGELWPKLVQLEKQLQANSQSVLKQATHQAEAFSRKAIQVNENAFLTGIICVIVVVLTLLFGGGFIVRSITLAIGRVIVSLTSQADEVSSVSGQVSTTSQSLAQGASRQAATLEDTSSSMEQMSSQTLQNAQNAQKADSAMREAMQIASQATQSMQKMAESMGEITSIGNEIGTIIKTIDQVAFQTNLLALNAAVEAARAGEAGAGFAVVAEEVRSLAQKTAAAAKNTSQIVKKMIDKIEAGNQFVQEADIAFSKVSTSAGGVAEMVGQINSASNEQSEGIKQVNAAMTQMDQVTQGNAANADETASLSDKLKIQAEQLLDMVGSLEALVGGNGKGRARNRKRSIAVVEHAETQLLSMPDDE